MAVALQGKGRSTRQEPTASSARKPYGRSHEAILKQTSPSLHQVDRGHHVMWTIINAVYEEYCQARLDEMLRIDAVKTGAALPRRDGLSASLAQPR